LNDSNYFLCLIYFCWLIVVRRPTLSPNTNSTSCPGIGRRIGDYPNIKPLVPIRYNTTNNNSNSSMTNARSNILTKADIDIQKENKFKQIVEQSNVDLSKNKLSNIFVLFFFLFI